MKRLTFGRIAEGGQGLSIQAVIKTRVAVECHCSLPWIIEHKDTRHMAIDIRHISGSLYSNCVTNEYAASCCQMTKRERGSSCKCMFTP